MSLHHLPSGNVSNLLISNHLLLRNYPQDINFYLLLSSLIPSLSYSLPLFFLLFNPSFLSPSFPPSFSPLLPPSTYSLGIYSVTDSV